MGDEPIALGDSLEMFTDFGGVHLGDAGTRHLDGGGADLVETSGAGGDRPGHPTIVPHGWGRP
ncbi:hypothetical protein GCM10009541_25080 [Micromonospora gifhornensis]